MLELIGLKKCYGTRSALDGLDLTVREGAVCGFVGENGAGKTTALRIAAGIIRPDAGEVRIAGLDALSRPREAKAKIGYVPDSFGYYENLRVAEYMEFFAACYGLEGYRARERSQLLLAQVGLEYREDTLVDSLSRGMKQRLSLARALIHDPPLLLLDEPTAGLDPKTGLEFREMLRELSAQGKTVLISSHILSELAQICTDVGIIDAGRLVLSGSIEEIFDRTQTAKPIVISVQAGLAQALSLLRAHPSVRSVTVSRNRLRAEFVGGAGAEAGLLKELVEAGVAVNEFVRETGSLESVFLKIVGRDERKVVLTSEGESGLQAGGGRAGKEREDSLCPPGF